MFWKINVKPLILAVMSRRDDGARERALRDLQRKRRRAVPALIELLKSSIFNFDKYFAYSEAAAQILVLLGKMDGETYDLIVRRLLAASEEQGFQVRPAAVLSALGYDDDLRSTALASVVHKPQR